MEGLDILGNQYQREAFCKVMKKCKCNGDCAGCMLEFAYQVQQYGNQKGRRYYKSRKWDLHSLIKECMRY